MNNIQISNVETRNVFNWIGRGWTLFKEQSGLWMKSFFFIYGLMMLSGGLGIIGIIAFFLAYPFLLAGFYHMAFKANNGVQSTFNDLFVAFRDGRVRRVMIQVGAVGLFFMTLMSPMSAEIIKDLTEGLVPNSNTVAMYIIVNYVYDLLFMFAVATAWFYHEQSVFKVVKAAFAACLSNPLPIVVFILLSIGMALATIPTLLLALIIVKPWLMISGYLAFNDIFCPPLPQDDDKGDDQDFTFRV